MIPTIGLLIGVYVILRSLDLICASGSRYATERVRVLMITACILTIGLTAFLLTGLMLQSSGPITSYDSSTPTPEYKPTPAEIEKQRRENQELFRRGNEGH